MRSYSPNSSITVLGRTTTFQHWRQNVGNTPIRLNRTVCHRKQCRLGTGRIKTQGILMSRLCLDVILPSEARRYSPFPNRGRIFSMMSYRASSSNVRMVSYPAFGGCGDAPGVPACLCFQRATSGPCGSRFRIRASSRAVRPRWLRRKRWPSLAGTARRGPREGAAGTPSPRASPCRR